MLKLTISVASVEVDYTRYVDQRSIKINEQINTPTQCQFSLTPIGKDFRVPPQRAYVRLFSTMTGRSLFTGFIASEPVRQYLALSAIAPTEQGGQLFQFDITCASDEVLLNTKAVPFIPAYINRGQGEILANLAEVLCPRFFDTSMVATGDLVPFFEYSPTQSWTEVAKLFADGSRYRYKVRDKLVYYQPYGDGPLGIDYDERKRQSEFAPKDLKTTVLSVPTVNDVLIIGDTEAGNNREDYFIGDGFTGNYSLLHKVFRGTSSILVQETWNGGSVNTQQWFLEDLGNNFDFSAGALNLTDTFGSPYPLGESYLLLNNGIELAGGIDLQVGECIWIDTSQGVLGGIYRNQDLDDASLLAGFKITSPSGVVTSASGCAGVVMQPWLNGAPVGDPVVSEINHSYVLQIVIHAPKYSRFNRVYRTLEGEEFGGGDSTVDGSITFVIQDTDIGKISTSSPDFAFYYQPPVTQVSVESVTLPAFAVYALVNNEFLNVSIVNTLLATMPLGGLTALEGPSGLARPSGLILPMLPEGHFIETVQPWPNPASGNILADPLDLGTVEQVLVMGNGFAQQAAQISPGNSADTLAFYRDTIPAAGTRVRLQTWEAQAAVSRLQVSGSILQEAFVVGDDGIRSAIVTDLNPLPRTSEDCDNAALAFLKDRVGVFYNGTYDCTSLFFHGLSSDEQYWPTVGRFLNINAPRRGIDQQKYLVTKLTIAMLDMVTELVQFRIEFGADLYLEKVIKNFVDLKPANVLSPADKANPPNPRFTQNVANSFLPDLTNTHVELGTITPVNVNVLVEDDYLGPIEIRRLDTNWGRGQTPDLVAIERAPSFVLARGQFDQVWYLRAATASGSATTQPTSRRSKVLRVRWPVTPATPIFVGASQTRASNSVDGSTINSLSVQFAAGGDLRNIYGFELRASDNATVLVQKPTTTNQNDLLIDLSQTPLDYLTNPDLAGNLKLYAYFFTVAWDYSDPLLVELQLVPDLTDNWFARAIIPGIQVVASDVLSNRYRVKIDPTTKVNLDRCSTTAKIAPASGVFSANILVSRDKSVTFNTLFGVQPSLAVGATTGEDQDFVITELFNDDELKVDITAADGVCSGIELVLKGRLGANE